MIVTLEEVKEHARIDFDDDDALIESKIRSAQAHLENLLGFKIEERYGGEDQQPVPEPLKECVCRLTAHWYDNRHVSAESSDGKILPFGVTDVVNEYRDWSWGEPPST